MRRLALACALLVLASACPKKDAVPPDTGVVVDDDRTQTADEMKAVYDVKTPATPAALAVCDALLGLPATKKAGCCKETTAGPSAQSPVVTTCAGVLSAALAAKDVSLDEARTKACIDARTAQLEGCGWVGALAPPAPDACDGLVTGLLDEGARCRSSLACKAGLRCHGASTLDTGRCGRPLPAGSKCGANVDGLAVVVGQAQVEETHRECEGACVLGKCQPLLKAGDACKSDVECGPSGRCDDGTCAVGAREVLARKKDGEACKTDFECERGGCTNGACGMKCTSWKDLSP